MNPRPPGYEPGELPDCSTPRRLKIRWNVGPLECERCFRPTFQPLTFQPPRAGNGTRTRDPNLGKVVLYQLSYSRVPPKSNRSVGRYLPPCHRFRPSGLDRPAVGPSGRPSGGEGDRTPDLVNAIHALSQLSYAPAIFPRPKPALGTRHLIGAFRRCQAIFRLFYEHFRCHCVLQNTK